MVFGAWVRFGWATGSAGYISALKLERQSVRLWSFPRLIIAPPNLRSNRQIISDKIEHSLEASATLFLIQDYIGIKERHLSLNEEALLKEIEVDPHKFGEIYDAFYEKIFGYAFRRTANYDAAKDIAAETFLKAYTGIGKFKWRNVSVLHWLYRIATNELNKYFAGRSYAPESLNRIREEYGTDVTDYSNAETERIQLEEDLERHQEFVKINKLVAKLDIKYQDVISLRYYEQKSIKEIAMILGKREGTVKSLLSRGLDKLKGQMVGEQHETIGR